MKALHQISDAAFKDAYASLNAAQKEAIDTIEGPVMVIAGPGTGKTQILTLRIANILRETQMDPGNILALTFTEAGAKAMRERLHRYIGAAAYQVAIFTFHGFAERLIREYPDAYTKVIGGRAASDLDKINILEDILQDAQFKLLRPLGNTAYYVKPILHTIGSLKQEYITPDRFAAVVAGQEVALQEIEQYHDKGAHKGKVRGEYTKAEKSLAKNRELLSVYRLYEAALADQRLYDFDDMILETVLALEENEDMLRDLQETYQYILADEHQDVNGSQNKILELLANFHDQPNIFVVGDEKQAIYRFQGASLENFLYFEDLFPKTKRISLTENYRSGQTILDTAHSLVAVEEGPLAALRVPLTAEAVQKSQVERRDFSHQVVEDEFVVKEALRLVENGVSPAEIAVIVRTNREVEQLAALLRKQGLPVEASADGDILDHPITHTIQNIMTAITESHDESALFALLHGSYWGIPANDLVKIVSSRSYGTSLWSILTDEQKLNDLNVSNVEAVTNLVQTLETARRRADTDAPHRVLEFVLQESGFLNHVMVHDAVEGGRVVRRLYDEIEKMVVFDKKTILREVSTVLASYKAHRIAVTAPYIANNTAAIQVMTAHKSKGLEFSHVFIPHAADSVWGGTTKRQLFSIPLATHDTENQANTIDDERRLLYVAITRAKETVYLSYAAQNVEGKQLVASRLFDSLVPEDITNVAVTDLEKDFDPLASLQNTGTIIPIDSVLLKTQLLARGLSATALNNYLRSPYDYLYRNVLRIPEVQALPMQYGTALHGVMEWAVGERKNKEKWPSTTAIKDQLTTQLSRLPLTDDEFVRLHEKGLEALVPYIQHIAPQVTAEQKTEFSIQVSLPTELPEFPELTLKGNLDRLDFDDEGNVVRVVDYKTGKPKTRNDIEGKTKTSNGDYKRQLVFYALLLELYEDERYQCREGVLSFIEPDSKGVIHEEVFVITDEEISELKTELIRVAKEITTGSFLQTPCDPTESSYCDLAGLLQG